jgi:hypothetical protein
MHAIHFFPASVRLPPMSVVSTHYPVQLMNVLYREVGTSSRTCGWREAAGSGRLLPVCFPASNSEKRTFPSGITLERDPGAVPAESGRSGCPHILASGA